MRRPRTQRYVCIRPGPRRRAVGHDPAAGLLMGFGVLAILAFAFLASLAVAA